MAVRGRFAADRLRAAPSFGAGKSTALTFPFVLRKYRVLAAMDAHMLKWGAQHSNLPLRPSVFAFAFWRMVVVLVLGGTFLMNPLMLLGKK